MTTAAIRQKLVDYLKIADDKKVKAIYTMVEDEINTQANDLDENFIAELESRSSSLKDKSARTYTWEETKKAAKKAAKPSKR